MGRKHLERARAIRTELAARPFDEILADYGVRYTDEPYRGLAGIAWLLDITSGERPSRSYTILENSTVASPGCGTRADSRVVVSRLIISNTTEVGQAVRASYPRGSDFNPGYRLYAHSRLKDVGRLPGLLTGMGDQVIPTVEGLLLDAGECPTGEGYLRGAALEGELEKAFHPETIAMLDVTGMHITEVPSST